MPLLVRVALPAAAEGIGGGGRRPRPDRRELRRVEIVVALVGRGVHHNIGVVGRGTRVVGARRVEVGRHVEVRVRAPRHGGLADEV